MTIMTSFSPLGNLFFAPFMTRREMILFQERQLRRIIQHAYRNVPYYRKHFDRHRIRPGDIRTAADLVHVPPTGKEDLVQLPAGDLVASGHDIRRLVTHQTSGTSGVPSVIRRTWLEERVLHAFRWRARHGYGMRPTDRVAVVTLIGKRRPRFRKINEALGLYRLYGVDCLAEPEQIITELRRIRPALLSGYPGVLAKVAGCMDRRDLRSIRPRIVVTGGEVLTQTLRRRIGSGFRTPVYDMYGALEFTLMAWTCRDRDYLHTCDDLMVLEVIRDGRPAEEGESGEVIGTSLWSYAMPFIRYRLGDQALRGPGHCPCGAPFATLKAVEGRRTDYFRLPGGREIHPYSLFEPILQHAYPWIRQYQLLQETMNRVKLRLVSADGPPPASLLARLQTDGEKVLGDGISFEVSLVSSIASRESGKIPTYRSLVAR